MTGPTVKTKFSICSTANPDIDFTTDASAIVDFTALTYVEIKFVETAGDLGADRDEIVGKTLNQGVVRYVGSEDAGAIELTCLRDSLDPGQVAAVAAGKTYDKYAIRIELNDKPPVPLGTPSFFYMLAVVSMPRTNFGTATDIAKRVFRITPSKVADVVEVPATAPPGP